MMSFTELIRGLKVEMWVSPFTEPGGTSNTIRLPDLGFRELYKGIIARLEFVDHCPSMCFSAFAWPSDLAL